MGAHWAVQYIGQAWKSGARGPDMWDCWGFLQHVQQAHYGRELPMIDDVDTHNLRNVIHTIKSHPERSNWRQISQPQDGAAVLLGYGRDTSHVGVHLALDGGGVLHCQRHCGVVFSRTAVLATAGWKTVEYYLPAKS